MTDYTKLADAAVRAGVGECRPDLKPRTEWKYLFEDQLFGAAAFIKDGRTVLALLLLCAAKGHTVLEIGGSASVQIEGIHGPWDYAYGTSDESPTAIAEACLRALGEIE